MIDIHCHILPEVDDGPKSWETAEKMCRMALADGIEHLVATPHANHRYYYERPYLVHLLELLEARLGGRPTLSLGCDLHLSYENMQSALGEPQRYSIADTRYLLVEFSDFSISPRVDDWFRAMHAAGVRTIITHPERNPLLQQDPRRIFQWIELGSYVQLTASSLTGHWGGEAQQAAERLLEQKAASFLATDAHDAERRPPILSEARRLVMKQFGEPLAEALVETNPGAVIRNQPLPV